MPGEKGRAVARVEHHEARLVEPRGHVVEMHPARLRQCAEHGGADLVDVLHVGKVGRRLRLAAEDEIHERLFVPGRRELECGIEFFLVAEGRVGHRAERLAARAARAVRRKHLHMAGQFGDFPQAAVTRARPGLLGAHETGGLLQQIGPARVPDEKKIAAQHRHRFICAAAEVGHEIDHVLRRVARCVDGLKFDVADFETIAVTQPGDVWPAVGPFTLPVRTALSGDVDLHLRVGGRQFARATHKVSVDVRLGDGGEAQPLLRGEIPVAVDVALGVDDNGLAGALAADEVGVLGEMRVGDLAEKHGAMKCGF